MPITGIINDAPSPPAGPSNKPLLFLRITNGISTNPHPGTTLNPGQSIPLKAVLIGDAGTVIQTVAVVWSTSGSLEPTDLTTASASQQDDDAIFSATKISQGNISATVIDLNLPIFDQYNLSSINTVSGTMIVSHSLVEDSINVLSGNTQTAAAGSLVTSPLQVVVVNVGGTPVPGVTVTFESSVANNGGQILCGSGSGQVTTNISGIASCQVRLGGNLGAGNQVFSAKITQGSSRTASFNLSATYGAPYKLGFIQEPTAASRGTSMVSLPVTVAVLDQFSNVVPTATHAISLAKYSGNGSGFLGGTLTFNAGNGGVSGVAKFTTLSYSAAELNVKFEATSNPVLQPVVSTAFDVSDVIMEARCTVENANFMTAEGGCRDRNAGNIWSASSEVSPTRPAGYPTTGLLSYHQAVWDETRYALGDRTPEEADLAITNDYDKFRTNQVLDTSSLAYCQQLVESGYNDWRLPTIDEYLQAFSNASATALKNITVKLFWTASTENISNGNVYIGRLDSSAVNWTGNSSPFFVRCVRRSPPSKLNFTVDTPLAPTQGFGVYMPFEVAPEVYVSDSQGIRIKRAGIQVRLTAHKQSDNSQVNLWFDNQAVPNLVRTTDANGNVTFSDVGVTFAGNIYLKAQGINVVGTSLDYNTLTQAQSIFFNVQTQFPFGKCKSASSIWADATGGCKDVTSGLIWSSFTGNKTSSWNDAIWDETVLGATSADVDDFNRTNDYTPFQADPNQDSTPRSYCKDSRESNLSDWRMPNATELGLMGGNTPVTNLNVVSPGTFVWSSTVSDANYAQSIRFSDRYHQYWDHKSLFRQVVCVRRDPPAQLSVALSTSPQAPSYAVGAGFQVTVRVKDSSGAPSFPNGIATLTLNSGSTGSIWESGLDRGPSFSAAITNGVAVFNINYLKNETIKFTVSGTASWKNTTINLSPIDTALIDFEPSTSAACKISPPAGWVNDSLAGCTDTANNKTWTHMIQGTTGWSSFSGRQSACSALRLGGYSNWRVPTNLEWEAAAARNVQAAIQNFTAVNDYGSNDGQFCAISVSTMTTTCGNNNMATICVRNN